jgi:hypothetical protein
MFPPYLPFDYVKLIDRGDRLRATHERVAESRFRTRPRGRA